MSRKEKTIAYLDSLVGKYISRKFQVWFICTVAFFIGMMNEDNYLWISSCYIGLETVLDLSQLARSLKSKGKSGLNSSEEQYPPAEMPPPNNI